MMMNPPNHITLHASANTAYHDAHIATASCCLFWNQPPTPVRSKFVRYDTKSLEPAK